MNGGMDEGRVAAHMQAEARSPSAGIQKGATTPKMSQMEQVVDNTRRLQSRAYETRQGLGALLDSMRGCQPEEATEKEVAADPAGHLSQIRVSHDQTDSIFNDIELMLTELKELI